MAPTQVFGGLLLVLVLAFLLVPVVIAIPMSLGTERFLQFPPRDLTLKWYGEFFTDAEWRAATVFSVKVAALTTVLSVLVGTLAAVALTMGLQWRLKHPLLSLLAGTALYVWWINP